MWMMSSSACFDKAAMCEVQAEQSLDEGVRADWLGMAAYWRVMGEDADGRGVIGRLMHGPPLAD